MWQGGGSFFSVFTKCKKSFVTNLACHASPPPPSQPRDSHDPSIIPMLLTSEAESKDKHGVWDSMPELIITSPYVHSRIDSNTFTVPWATLCQSRLYCRVRDFGFGLYCNSTFEHTLLFTKFSTSGLVGIFIGRLHLQELFGLFHKANIRDWWKTVYVVSRSGGEVGVGGADRWIFNLKTTLFSSSVFLSWTTKKLQRWYFFNF